MTKFTLRGPPPLKTHRKTKTDLIFLPSLKIFLVDVFFHIQNVQNFSNVLVCQESLVSESKIEEVQVEVAAKPESFRSSSSSSRASSRYSPTSTPTRQIRILSHDFSDTNDGNWNYAFESENGIRQEARGEMRSIGDALVRIHLSRL